MKDEAEVFIKMIVSKMSTVIDGTDDTLDPKAMAYEDKYKLKRKAKSLIKILVRLKIEFTSGREALWTIYLVRSPNLLKQ